MTLAVTSTWLLVLRSEMVLLVCCQVVQEIDAIYLNKNKIMEDGGMRLVSTRDVGLSDTLALGLVAADYHVVEAGL